MDKKHIALIILLIPIVGLLVVGVRNISTLNSHSSLLQILFAFSGFLIILVTAGFFYYKAFIKK